MRRLRARAGFTLLELLVVVSVMGVLLALVLASLARARAAARTTLGAANLRSIGLAAQMHLDDHNNVLPQRWVEVGAGTSYIIPPLFAGKRGSLDFFEINTLGADARPLNAYLGGPFGAHDEVEMCSDPDDTGATNAMPLVLGTSASSMYELVGTSYVLNDHALDAVPCPFVEYCRTLIPGRDLPMPPVFTPSRTILAGDQSMYNFDEGADQGMRWRTAPDGRILAKLLFVNLHVNASVSIHDGVVNATSAYSFYPFDTWSTTVSCAPPGFAAQ